MLQTLVHVGAEKMTMIQNAPLTQRISIIERVLKELDELRNYMNQSLLQKGIQMGIVVPQIGNLFKYGWSSREEMKEAKKENTIIYPSEVESEILSDEEKNEDENKRIILEIGGDFIEMTSQQANEILGV
jgi:hypothetical protein